MRLRVFAAGLAAVLLMAGPLGCSAQDAPERYIAGEHYTELDTPLATASGDKVEVLEFFLYSCSHCSAFDPAISAWADKLPSDVAFRRIPVNFSALGPLFAHAYYTAKNLGVLHTLHPLLFTAIHEQHRDLTTAAKLREFFVENGVSGEDFDAMFDSQQVKDQVAHAFVLMREYRIDGVPAMAVAGKYKLTGSQAGSNDAMLSVADFLIEKARAGR